MSEYSIGGVEDGDNQIIIGVKFNNTYRYFVLVLKLEKGYSISIVSKNGEPLDHYVNFTTTNIQQTVLDLCRDYDRFWYPEFNTANEDSVS